MSPNPAARAMRLLAALAAAGSLAACSSGAGGGAATSAGTSTTPAAATTAAGALVSGALKDKDGKDVGTVEIRSTGGSATSATTGSGHASGMEVRVSAHGLPAGFHGLHVHAVGKCELNSPDPKDTTKLGDFLSAGGHLAGGGVDHPDHAGDLPSLQVGQDGTASLVAVSSRLTADLLTDADGASLVVHEHADNYANIPTRYASAGADADTKKAGDGGPRIACAVLAKP